MAETEINLDLRAVEAAKTALKANEAKKALLARVHSLLRACYVVFNELQKKLPPNESELEFHQDRLVFVLGGRPLTVIYMPEDRPMYVEINKKAYLAERVYICDANFGDSSGELLGPKEREAGSIFVCDEVYVVRWQNKVEVWNTDTELIDSFLNSYYLIQDKHTDRDGNEIQISTDAWLYGQRKPDAPQIEVGEVPLPAPTAARPNLSAYNFAAKRRP